MTKRRCSWLQKILLGFLGLLFVTSLWGFFRLGPNPSIWPAKVLVREDPLEKADAIVIMMGGVSTRANRAYELYQQGIAPKIIFLRTDASDLELLGYRLNDGDATFRYLQSKGVPASALLFLSHLTATSTKEEAASIIAYLAKQESEIKSIVVVTDWYHTARAGWIFDATKPEDFKVFVAAATGPANSPETWYRFEGNFLATFNEYIKWLYYFVTT